MLAVKIFKYFQLYHCGANTNALVLANMVTPMKVRQAGLRRRKLRAKWPNAAFTTARNIVNMPFTHMIERSCHTQKTDMILSILFVKLVELVPQNKF